MTEYLIYFNQQWVGDHTEEWFRGRGPLAMAVVGEMKAAGVYVFAGGLEEEATFLPLIVERMETQVRDLRQMAAIEAMLSAQAIDLLGDAPHGVTRIAYDRVRAVSPVYLKDRPLSKEIEVLHHDFACGRLLEVIVAAAPMPEFDDFFALGQ